MTALSTGSCVGGGPVEKKDFIVEFKEATTGLAVRMRHTLCKAIVNGLPPSGLINPHPDIRDWISRANARELTDSEAYSATYLAAAFAEDAAATFRALLFDFLLDEKNKAAIRKSAVAWRAKELAKARVKKAADKLTQVLERSIIEDPDLGTEMRLRKLKHDGLIVRFKKSVEEEGVSIKKDYIRATDTAGPSILETSVPSKLSKIRKEVTPRSGNT